MTLRTTRALLCGALVVVAACGDGDDLVAGPESDPPRPEPTDEPVAVDESTTTRADEARSDGACPPADGSDQRIDTFDAPPPFCLDPSASYTATVSTSAGDVTIQLDPAAAPNTVNNFVFLARNNYFDDTICHRIIQGFVVQCGDPTATGTGGPGYRFDDELPEAGEYQVGSIAMANSGPDTNGSQFFIITGQDGASLPPLYSLFGHVDGADLDVVATMDAQGSLDPSGIPTTELRILEVTIEQT